MKYSSENPECCSFPKGSNFDYVRVYKENGRIILEGKGKLGCVTKMELNQEQLNIWLNKYKQSLREKQ
jgi:hypothetical protein